MEDLKDKEKSINRLINQIFEYHYDEDSAIFHNIKLFEEAFYIIKNNLQHIYDDNNENKIDWYKVKHADFLKKVSIINDFFKYLNIDYDINVPLSDGTFVINTNSFEEIMQDQSLIHNGSCGYDHYIDGGNYIEVSNNDLIVDAIIWVHELGHYHNITNAPEPEARKFLTESMAFTYEFIFTDYLKSIGYVYEAISYKINDTINLFKISYECFILIKFFLIYDTFSEINRENYLKIYKNDYYEQELERTLNIIQTINIFLMIEYTIAAGLSLYMYYEYKKDHSFIKTIEQFNNAIKSKPFFDCLKLLGFNVSDNYYKEEKGDSLNAKKIIDSIKYLQNEIEEELQELNNNVSQDRSQVK